MNGEAVGRRMAALRRRRGLTRREFAERADLSQGQLSRLENGRQGFRSETLIRVAEVLRVEPYRLLLPVDGYPLPPPQGAVDKGEGPASPESKPEGASDPTAAADRPPAATVGGAAHDATGVGKLDGALLEALRAPEFVSLLEDVARAHRTSSASFGALKSVMAAVLRR